MKEGECVLSCYKLVVPSVCLQPPGLGRDARRRAEDGTINGISDLGTKMTFDSSLLDRAAYLQRLREVHPDRGGSVEALSELQDAYATAAAGASDAVELEEAEEQTLRRLLAAAFRRVLDEAGVFVAHEEASRPRVRRVEPGLRSRGAQETNGAPFDYFSPSALSVYRALQAAPVRGKKDDEEEAKKKDGAARRDQEQQPEAPFPSALAFASAVVASFPPEAYSTLQFIRAARPGFINMTLAHRLIVGEPTAAGRPNRVCCPICGGAFGAGRGLRMHLTSKRHGLRGEPLQEAIRAVEASQGSGEAALPPPIAGPLGAPAPAATASAAAAAGAAGGSRHRDAYTLEGDLDPGLLACKLGDLVRLKECVGGAQGGSAAAAGGGGGGGGTSSSTTTTTSTTSRRSSSSNSGSSVNAGWDASAVVDKNGSHALHYAAGGGHDEVCRYLVEELGVDVNQRVTAGRRDGRTALAWAARNGHLRTVKWLVAHGAVPSPTKDGTTPFHWAAWQSHLHVCRWLMEKFGDDVAVAANAFGCNAMHWTALSGDVEACRWLHSVGVDPRKRNTQGHTPVHKAAWRGQLAVLEWMSDAAADDGVGLPSAAFGEVDDGGYSPADIARLAGFDEVKSWLERKAAAQQ